MDITAPTRLPKDFYHTKYFKNSKAAFLSQISAKCEGQEDVTACVEKYANAFDSVFNHLKTRLEEEERVIFYFDKRAKNVLGELAYFRTHEYNSGYENWN